MANQAVGIVTLDPDGKPVKALAGKIMPLSGFTILTNEDAYDRFDNLPLPLRDDPQGTRVLLTLQGKDENGKVYQVPLNIPDVPNVTLRVGGRKIEPQDIELPPVVPFA